MSTSDSHASDEDVIESGPDFIFVKADKNYSTPV